MWVYFKTCPCGQWLAHSAAMCSRVWSAQWTRFPPQHLSPGAFAYQRIISNNSYAHGEHVVNPGHVRGFDGVRYKLWSLLMPWLAASRCQLRWRGSRSRQMWLNPLAKRWRNAGQGWRWISASPGLARQYTAPRGGAFTNTRQAAHAYSSLPPPYTTRIYTGLTYQFPSSPWAGALDRHKGLNAGVQSRLDPCPQERSNERTSIYKYVPRQRKGLTENLWWHDEWPKLHQLLMVTSALASTTFLMSRFGNTWHNAAPSVSTTLSWSRLACLLNAGMCKHHNNMYTGSVYQSNAVSYSIVRGKQIRDAN